MLELLKIAIQRIMGVKLFALIVIFGAIIHVMVQYEKNIVEETAEEMTVLLSQAVILGLYSENTTMIAEQIDKVGETLRIVDFIAVKDNSGKVFYYYSNIKGLTHVNYEESLKDNAYIEKEMRYSGATGVNQYKFQDYGKIKMYYNFKQVTFKIYFFIGLVIILLVYEILVNLLIFNGFLKRNIVITVKSASASVTRYIEAIKKIMGNQDPKIIGYLDKINGSINDLMIHKKAPPKTDLVKPDANKQ